MISNQILQNTIDGIKSIARVDVCVMDVEGKVVVCTEDMHQLTKAASEFQDKYSKGLYTQSTAEVKAQEIQKMEAEYNQYVATKDQELQQEQIKMQNTANEELLVMNNTINDAINTFIVKYNQEKI